MIVGYHLIWTVYGSWLPNDPRGSSSRKVHSTLLAELGELHFGRKKIQPAGREIRAFYDEAKGLLKHDLLTFSPREIDVVGKAIGEVVRKSTYTCYACAVMPDHVHVLIRRHRDQAPAMLENLQEASRLAILEHGERPKSHPVWGGPGWKVYLDTAADMQRVRQYIEANPRKIGRDDQHWDFVRSYDGWMPGRAQFQRPAKSQARRDRDR